MRIDLPRCNLKNCRYCFDSNCTKNTEYERCGFRLAKTEAIKEFAERLKYHAHDIVLYGEIVTVSRIERTMHEMMTEGKDGNV